MATPKGARVQDFEDGPEAETPTEFQRLGDWAILQNEIRAGFPKYPVAEAWINDLPSDDHNWLRIVAESLGKDDSGLVSCIRRKLAKPRYV